MSAGRVKGPPDGRASYFYAATAYRPAFCAGGTLWAKPHHPTLSLWERESGRLGRVGAQASRGPATPYPGDKVETVNRQSLLR